MRWKVVSDRKEEMIINEQFFQKTVYEERVGEDGRPVLDFTGVTSLAPSELSKIFGRVNQLKKEGKTALIINTTQDIRTLLENQGIGEKGYIRVEKDHRDYVSAEQKRYLR